MGTRLRWAPGDLAVPPPEDKVMPRLEPRSSVLPKRAIQVSSYFSKGQH